MKLPIALRYPIPIERLELLQFPDASHASNRAAPSIACQLAADNDLDAVRAWLAEFHQVPQTLRTYRKEAERLLLWALIERGKPLSSLTREDLLLYEAFLANPQPQERWCGKRLPRTNAQWRPFLGPLAPHSRKQALLIINSLFGYLVRAGYLAGNPLALMRRRNSGEHQRQVERFLEQDQWQALLATVQDLPRSAEREQRYAERSRYLIALLYLLGPRVSEVAEHTMGSFVQIRGRWWWQVVGKGSKQAQVPVNQEMLDALTRYRQFYGLARLPTPEESTPLVMNLQGTKGIGGNMIYRIIKQLVNQAADHLAITNPYQAAKLRRASTHWLRHTSITHQVEAGINLHFLQRNARHARLDTTGRYIHAEEKDWHEAMQLHCLRSPKRFPSK